MYPVNHWFSCFNGIRTVEPGERTFQTCLLPIPSLEPKLIERLVAFGAHRMVIWSLNSAKAGGCILAKLAGVRFPFIEESIPQTESPVSGQQNTFPKVDDRCQIIALLPERLLYLISLVQQRQGRGCANHLLTVVDGKQERSIGAGVGFQVVFFVIDRSFVEVRKVVKHGDPQRGYLVKNGPERPPGKPNEPKRRKLNVRQCAIDFPEPVIPKVVNCNTL